MSYTIYFLRAAAIVTFVAAVWRLFEMAIFQIAGRHDSDLREKFLLPMLINRLEMVLLIGIGIACVLGQAILLRMDAQLPAVP